MEQTYENGDVDKGKRPSSDVGDGELVKKVKMTGQDDQQTLQQTHPNPHMEHDHPHHMNGVGHHQVGHMGDVEDGKEPDNQTTGEVPEGADASSFLTSEHLRNGMPAKSGGRRKRLQRVEKPDLIHALRDRRFEGKLLDVLVAELEKDSISGHTQHDFLRYYNCKVFDELIENCNRTTLRLICRARGIKSASNNKEVLSAKLADDTPARVLEEHAKEIRGGGGSALERKLVFEYHAEGGRHTGETDENGNIRVLNAVDEATKTINNIIKDKSKKSRRMTKDEMSELLWNVITKQASLESMIRNVVNEQSNKARIGELEVINEKLNRLRESMSYFTSKIQELSDRLKEDLPAKIADSCKVELTGCTEKYDQLLNEHDSLVNQLTTFPVGDARMDPEQQQIPQHEIVGGHGDQQQTPDEGMGGQAQQPYGGHPNDEPHQQQTQSQQPGGDRPTHEGSMDIL